MLPKYKGDKYYLNFIGKYISRKIDDVTQYSVHKIIDFDCKTRKFYTEHCYLCFGSGVIEKLYVYYSIVDIDNFYEISEQNYQTIKYLCGTKNNHTRNKTILIDIDDTIENLCETWVDWLNKQYGTSVKYNEITEWDMSKFFPNLTKEQIFEPLHNPKLWDYVQPKPGAVEYVKKLIDEGYNVYLCTTTDYRNVRPKFENVIKKHFPYINWNQVIIASRKQMINADVLVDDGVHNLENGNYIKILVSASHNASYDAEVNGMYRVNNWEEIYKLIHLLIGEPYEN